MGLSDASHWGLIRMGELGRKLSRGNTGNYIDVTLAFTAGVASESTVLKRYLNRPFSKIP